MAHRIPEHPPEEDELLFDDTSSTITYTVDVVTKNLQLTPQVRKAFHEMVRRLALETLTRATFIAPHDKFEVIAEVRPSTGSRRRLDYRPKEM